MLEAQLPELPALTDAERSCLSRYLSQAIASLEDSLLRVILFGSIARGESWPQGMPIRSDLDLLLVTDAPVPSSASVALIEATFPLFLECGRQISPQFRTSDQMQASDERGAVFLENVKQDGVIIFARA